MGSTRPSARPTCENSGETLWPKRLVGQGFRVSAESLFLWGNVLMYGVSPDWVEMEIARHAGAAAQRLADLVAAQVMPAVKLMREVEYTTTFYSMADFRGWGSDVH